MASTPLWRKAFDQAERRVGRPLEEMTGSKAFSNALAYQLRINKAIVKLYERRTAEVLHALNLPTFGDVNRVSRQLVAINRDLRELAARVDELNEDREASR